MPVPSPSATSESRRQAWKRGWLSEWLALWALRFKGYRILAHRYRAPGGEVDLIAYRKQLLIAVEVKHRASIDTALESITPRQQQRIRSGIEHFTSRHPCYANCGIRFDAVLCTPLHLPQHLPDAWRPEK